MARRKILVVDDEESMRYFLNRALSRAGYEVETSASGEDALAAIAASPPDLMLLDLRLPGIDGLSVLRKLRELEEPPQVLLMTGFGTVEGALDAMREGAADFITKPFKTEDLLPKIEEALRQAPAARREPAPSAPAAPPKMRAAPPRPLTAFLRESAGARGIEVAETETGDLPLKEASRVFEALYLTELIERTGGNVSLAARIAGVSRPSLHRKIADLSIDVTRFRR
jgi:DNA-binding NtrC family response regulator